MASTVSLLLRMARRARWPSTAPMALQAKLGTNDHSLGKGLQE